MHGDTRWRCDIICYICIMNIKVALALLLLICNWNAKAQHPGTKSDTISGEGYKQTPAKEPEYFSDYIARNMIYPEEALKNRKEGTVTIELVVEKDGSTSNARILRGKEIANGIPEEALRLIAAAPKWTAATVNNIAVRSYYRVQIKFLLPMEPGLSDLLVPQKQVESTVKIDENYIYRVVQVKPQPTFDQSEFIANNLRYPEPARENRIEGRVHVEFVVEKDGSITHVKAIRGRELGHGIPEEAVRVVKAMPKWSPAMMDGKIVRAYYLMPVVFNLQ